MPRVAVPLADGFEEIEAVTVIDVLRRAGCDVEVLALSGTSATGSHGITVLADSTLAARADVPWDAVVLPGGMPGAAHLRDDPTVQALVARQHAAGRWVAAICAAPIALSSAGVLRDRQATSYPGFDDQLDCAEYREDRVVVDRRVATSRGPGTALEFALALVHALVGPERAAALRTRMLALPDQNGTPAVTP